MMTTQGLMQYIINKLKDEQSVDLLILRELLKYMCNIENVEDMSDRSLMALAGGEILQQVTQQITSGAERSSRGVTKGYREWEFVWKRWIKQEQCRSFDSL